MTAKGATSQACAACKFQRRKCAPDCKLAPYFPPDQPKQFQNAHHLFGVSKIVKILKKVAPSQKAEAMRSIVCEANIRDKYPVHGCLGVIQTLRLQIQQAQQELDMVQAQLALCRQQLKMDQQIPPSPPPLPSSQLPLNTDIPPTNDAFSLANLYQQYSLAPQNSLPSSSSDQLPSNSYTNSSGDSMSAFWASQGTPCNSIDFNAVPVSSDFTYANQFARSSLEQDDLSPFFDGIDDRQSLIEPGHPYGSSPESSLKDATAQAIEHLGDTELKRAAAFFSLTSVN